MRRQGHGGAGAEGGGGKPHLAVFDTFRTRSGELTGEAVRQRAIIAALAAGGGPTKRTRTAVSQGIAGRKGWKNIYSGVFRDLDEVLLPLGLAEEEGRLPLKRGPRALQEAGIPYYRLTPPGRLVSMALGGSAAGDLEGLGGGELMGGLAALAGVAPGLAGALLEGYVRAYCAGRMGALLPLGLEGLREAGGAPAAAARELLEGLAGRPAGEAGAVAGFLARIAPGKAPGR